MLPRNHEDSCWHTHCQVQQQLTVNVWSSVTTPSSCSFPLFFFFSGSSESSKQSICAPHSFCRTHFSCPSAAYQELSLARHNWVKQWALSSKCVFTLPRVFALLCTSPHFCCKSLGNLKQALHSKTNKQRQMYKRERRQEK